MLMPIMSSLSGKVVLITGASSGIGEATAVLFARLRAKLALTGRNEVNLQKVNEQCISEMSSETDRPLLIVGDLTIDDDVRRIVDETIGKFGRLDVLVNNAGIGASGSIERTTPEQFDRVMNINVRAQYLLTKLAVPHLIATRGSIVNISSLYGTRSARNALAYCVSKSALDQLTRCVALELAADGVRVNGVAPGFVTTDIFRRQGLSEGTVRRFEEHYCKMMCPMGRTAEREEVPRVIAFLASDDASYITGQVLHVDGGSHVAPAAAVPDPGQPGPVSRL